MRPSPDSSTTPADYPTDDKVTDVHTSNLLAPGDVWQLPCGHIVTIHASAAVVGGMIARYPHESDVWHNVRALDWSHARLVLRIPTPEDAGR